jgi:hypothetical protein
MSHLRKPFSRRAGIFGATMLVLALGTTPVALAKTYKPNKRSDHSQNGCSKSDCTLREAISSANARPGSDKILLEGGKTYRISLGNLGGVPEDLNASGDFDITDTLTIQSDDDKLAEVRGNGLDRVFQVVKPTAALSAKFNRLEIRGGYGVTGATGPAGGGVRAETLGGTTSIVSSKIVGNGSSSGNGGGGVAIVFSSGASIDRTTITGNSVVGVSNPTGGGVIADTTGYVKVNRSTISRNLAWFGGGLSNDGSGLVVMTNSTVAENKAFRSGGGIFLPSAGAGGSISLASVTVARNIADADGTGSGDGGGLSRGPGATGFFAVNNSIVALNRRAIGLSDCTGTFVSQGVNLFTSLFDGCNGFALPPNLLTSNPKLGGLKSNGGPTKTMAIKSGSAAINNAGSSPKRDQRGEKRHNPDIGAYEKV